MNKTALLSKTDNEATCESADKAKMLKIQKKNVMCSAKQERMKTEQILKKRKETR